MAPNEPIKLLAPAGYHHKLSRRGFLQVGGAAAGLSLAVVACGGDDDDAGSSATEGASGSEAPAGTNGGGSDLLSQYSNVINKAEGNVAMYTWGDYNDPDIIGALAGEQLGITMSVDYYGSNEELISKLEGAKGTSGFDVVVPTGPYVPQMIAKGLLQAFDKSKLPNIVNVDPFYLGRDWDPGNEYSVCKDWGSCGFLWNTTVIEGELATWQDFLDAAMGPASGNMSVIDTPVNLLGLYFHANGMDWNTEDPAELDAAEDFLVNQLASHIKAFDSYPSSKIAEGAYALSHAWNGDARQAFVRIEEAGGNPDDWRWALGAPLTELWMDNYVIPVGAPNPDAAHAWINWLLTPEISIKDLNYHGYHSGMKNIDKLIAELIPDLQRADMIFFSDEQVKNMRTQTVNSAQDRQVDIYNKVKAKAGA